MYFPATSATSETVGPEKVKNQYNCSTVIIICLTFIFYCELWPNKPNCVVCGNAAAITGKPKLHFCQQNIFFCQVKMSIVFVRSWKKNVHDSTCFRKSTRSYKVAELIVNSWNVVSAGSEAAWNFWFWHVHHWHRRRKPTVVTSAWRVILLSIRYIDADIIDLF